MRYFVTQLLGGLIALLLVPGLALGQTGRLSGQVTEAETGDPLPGANVSIEGERKGTATNADGEYTLFQLQPGTYTVVVSFVGFQTVRRTNVEIVSDITNRLDFQLEQAAFEGQEVVVRAEEPLVNETATNAVRRLDREEIEALPTRSPETYYTLQAGVVEQNGEIHIRGARSDATDYLLEGISSRSLLGTNNVIPVIPEALEEVQVFAGGYAADKGGANGGIIQQQLRTGGEELSASAQYEGDQIADAFGNTYSYGDQDAVVTVGGPLYFDQHRFFIAANYRETENQDPLFWQAVNLNELDGGGLCSDVSESGCHAPVDDNTGESAPAPLQWDDGKVFGIRNPREEWRINGTLSFDFNPVQLRVSYAQVNLDGRTNGTPIEQFYNQRRVPEREDTRRLVSIQPTYFITNNTFLEGTLGFFQFDRQQFDPLFGTPNRGAGGLLPYLLDMRDRQAVAERLGIPTDSTSLAQNLYTKFWGGRYQVPDGFRFNGFRFDQPGQPNISYFERNQSYWNASLDLVSQQGPHTLKVGGDYKQWTVRNFSAAGTLTSNLASQAQNSPNIRDSLGAELDRFAQAAREGGVNYYGYDEFGNEIDSGPDGPKEPVTAAAYVNDRIEFENIIVSAGLRLNYFKSDSYVPQDRENPPFDGATAQIAVGGENGLEEADADVNILPRLGLSFPITERTVFHLQYGKFSQLPDLSNVYIGRGRLARIFSGGNFISDPFAWDVDPVRTTQYEIGFGHQFSEFAAFDLTAYYRRTDDQLTITRVETGSETDADPYNLYENGAFSITRGFEVSLRSKRIAGVRGLLNYTLSDAKGTATNPNSQVSALENRTPTPSQVQPLGFQQQHTGSVVVDYRSGPDRPLWAQNWGLNLLFRFSSGHPFTRSTGGIGQRGVDDGPLLVDTDPRNRVPLESINSSATPFTTQTDLRLQKGFDFGPATATAYIYVENLFNRRNAQNVYLRTGSVDSDGFLSNPELSGEIVANRGQDFVDYYQAINLENRSHYREGFGQDLLGTPRQIKVGISVSY